MAYLKSLAAGIAAATVLGSTLFAYRVYRSFQRHATTIHITDRYFPAWVPFGAIKIWLGVVLFLRTHAMLLLVILAFVVGFSWERYSVSMQTKSSPH